VAGEAYPEWFRPFAQHEGEATALRAFELAVVPGLLQTEEYARALLSTQVGTPGTDIDQRERDFQQIIQRRSGQQRFGPERAEVQEMQAGDGDGGGDEQGYGEHSPDRPADRGQPGSGLRPARDD
jgi:hypothetical protein